MEIIYKNKKIIKLIFEDIEHSNKTDWSIFLKVEHDPSYLLELNGFKMQYCEKIKWSLFSGNLGALHLLEKHQDYINWNELSKNPNICTYDYNKIKNDKKELNESIMQEVYKPSRIAKYLEQYQDVDDYLN